MSTIHAQDADFEWVEATGVSSGSSNNEQTHDVAVDGNNNVYAIGNKQGNINYWGGNFVSSGHKGSTDIWITKFDENQNFQWNTNIGGGGIDDGNGIDVDAAGNVYITGQFQQGFSGTEFGYAGFGDPVFTTLNPSTGNNIGFVAKINTNGVWQWVRTFEGGTCFPASISVDPNGNVYTTGRFSGTVDFNPGAGSEELTSSGSSQDAFISKLDNNGNFIWARQFSGGTFNDIIGRSITSDANDVYVKGYFEGTVEFELNTFGSTQLTGSTGTLNGDYFITKVEANGSNTRWAHLISRGSSSGYSLPGSTLALSDDGSNVYVTGEQNDRGFVARLTNGNFSVAEDWLVTFGSSSESTAIALDNSDNIFVTGYFNGTVDFDPGTGTENLSAIGNSDAFITRLDDQGEFVFAKQLGGPGADNRGYGIQIGTNGEIYSGGWFTETTDFDPNTGTENRTSEGARDLYIHKMFETTSACNEEFATDTRTECEGYTWIDGNQYFADNNTATHTVVDAVAPGCDSIYTLDLTIIPNSTGNEEYSGCEGDGHSVTVNGTVYNESNPTGTETIVGGAASGCDSIVNINLTFNPPVTGTDVQTACGSFTWIDNNTYTESNNTATHTIENGAANGCDSIVTLDLTITNDGPDVNIENIENVSCFGGNDGSAEAVATGGTPGYTYEWIPSGGTDSVATNLSAGEYIVEVTDSQGCIGRDTVEISQSDAIAIDELSISDANCGSNNGQITFDVVGGTPDYNYEWDETTDSTSNISGLSSGNYTVTVTDDEGCSFDTTFTVGTTGNLDIEAIPSEATIQEGGSVGLSVDVPDDTENETYTWTPEDGLSCTDCPDPDASPNVTTTYYVTVETPDGCQGTDSVLVIVSDDCDEIFIPSMFSPNGDGENDEFCVYGDCIDKFEISIFNRWGQLIYSSDNQDNCWDGTFKGRDLNTGVFAYKVFITTEQGEEIEESGNITLTR